MIIILAVTFIHILVWSSKISINKHLLSDGCRLSLTGSGKNSSLVWFLFSENPGRAEDEFNPGQVRAESDQF